MNQAFDPYLEWLGIPPEERPINHYRLLGLTVGESDPKVIETATDERMQHVRSFQLGPHSDLTQKLLNQLSSAKLVLLNPAKRAAYDRKLAGIELVTDSPAASAPPAAEPAPPFSVPVVIPMQFPPQAPAPPDPLDAQLELLAPLEPLGDPLLAAMSAEPQPAMAAPVLAADETRRRVYLAIAGGLFTFVLVAPLLCWWFILSTPIAEKRPPLATEDEYARPPASPPQDRPPGEPSGEKFVTPLSSPAVSTPKLPAVTQVYGPADGALRVFGDPPQLTLSDEPEIQIDTGSSSLWAEFSADASRLYTTDGTLHEWDLRHGSQDRTSKAEAEIIYPPNDQYICVGNQRGLQVWRTSNLFYSHGFDMPILPSGFSTRDFCCLHGKTGKLTFTQVNPRVSQHWKGSMPELLDGALSPDGKHALTSHADGTLCRWELNHLRPVLRWSGRAGKLMCFLPDGRRALTTSVDRKSAVLWDTQTGQPIRTYYPSGGIHRLRLSHDGRMMLVAATNGRVLLLALQNGSLLHQYVLQEQAACLAFSPDDDLFVAGSSKLKVFRLRPGPRVSRDKMELAEVPEAELHAIRMIPSKLTGIAFECGELMWTNGEMLHRASLETRRYVGGSGVSKGMYGMVPTPFEDLVITAQQDGLLTLFDCRRHKVVTTFAGHAFVPKPETLLLAAMSPDGQVVFGEGDQGYLHLWSVRTGGRVATYTPESGVTAVALGPNGITMWGDNHGAVMLNSARERTKLSLYRHDGPVLMVSITSDGQRMFSVGGKRMVAYTTTPQEYLAWDADDVITAAAVSPGGKYLLVGDESQRVRLWDSKSHKCVRFWDRKGGAARYIGFSRDGKLAYVVGKPGFGKTTDGVQVWELPDYLVDPGNTPVLDRPVIAPRPATVAQPATSTKTNNPSRTSNKPSRASKGPPPPSAEDAARILAKLKIEHPDWFASRDYGMLAKLREFAQTARGEQKYVLYDYSIGLATEHGDPYLAWKLIDELGKAYDIDIFQFRRKALEAGSQQPRSQRRCAEMYVELIQQATELENYQAAAELLEPANKMAEQAGAGLVSRQLAELQEGVIRKRDLQKSRDEALTVLAERPDDPAANLTLGRQLTLAENNWQEGIPYLARGGDDPLAVAARQDQTNPTQATDRAALGDLWWDLATPHPEHAAVLQQRAAYWYRKAVSGLTGLNRIRIEKRIKEAPKPE